MRYERTTRKPTMIKAVHHAMQSSSELLALCAKYWNELANGYYLEHEEVHFDADKDAWIESDNKGNTYSTVDGQMMFVLKRHIGFLVIMKVDIVDMKTNIMTEKHLLNFLMFSNLSVRKSIQNGFLILRKQNSYLNKRMKL